MNTAKLEEALYDIDQKFAQKTDSEVKMIYAMIFTLTIALSYLLLWESSEAMLKDASSKVSAIQTKINSDETYLRLNPPEKIVQLDNSIKTIQDRYANYQDYNAYIKHKMRKISALYYDEQTWGEYLNSLSKNAKNYNIKLLNLDNKFAQSEEKFGHVLDITVKVTGGFHNIVKYINELEQSFLVVDVHQMDLSATNKLVSDLNISVWGITY